jgi:hypothetical protein
MNSAAPSNLPSGRETELHRLIMRDAPAIRPFAELNPEHIHWSELDRDPRGAGAAVNSELLTRDVQTFFGRFG